jgi:hypothetical protein
MEHIVVWTKPSFGGDLLIALNKRAHKAGVTRSEMARRALYNYFGMPYPQQGYTRYDKAGIIREIMSKDKNIEPKLIYFVVDDGMYSIMWDIACRILEHSKMHMSPERYIEKMVLTSIERYLAVEQYIIQVM